MVRPLPPLSIVLTAAIAPAGLVALTSFTHSPVAETFAAIVAVTLVLPPLSMALPQHRHKAILAVAQIVPVAGLMLCLPIRVEQWFDCIAIFASYVLFVLSCAIAGSSVLITLGFLLWLSWPIWLSQHVGGHQTIVNFIAAVHPLLALNGQLLDHAIWTERPLMYGWTALNQDVPFAIPVNIIPCVMFQCGLALILLLIAWWVRLPARSPARVDR